jgi:hypothetical protein
MSHNRSELEVEPYDLSDPPVTLDGAQVKYLYDEIKRIATTIQHLVEAAPQTADRAPADPRTGTIRWNVSPWDPLSDGLEGFVQYNGTAWAALAARA